jgi:L-rhamnose-H+ transport protein
MILISGVLNGSAAAPLKYARRSEWENLWLVQTVLAMLLIPWVLVWATISHPMTVFRNSSVPALAAAAGFGFGWGVGTLLYIIGVVMVGMSVSFAIILSLTATLGSLLPLIVQHPQELRSCQGHLLIASLVITIVGIGLCAMAGAVRAHAESSSAPQQAVRHFWQGIVVCVLSGVFSPMLNFAFAFGEPITAAAKKLGASPVWAANGLWAIALSAAFGLNAIYCLQRLGFSRSWSRFRDAPWENLIAGSMMGLLFFVSVIMYGIGAGRLGNWGTSAGWAIYMCATVFTANLWGLATGEWRNAPKKSYVYLGAGLLAITVAIILASPAS